MFVLLVIFTGKWSLSLINYGQEQSGISSRPCKKEFRNCVLQSGVHSIRFRITKGRIDLYLPCSLLLCIIKTEDWIGVHK